MFGKLSGKCLSALIGAAIAASPLAASASILETPPRPLTLEDPPAAAKPQEQQTAQQDADGQPQLLDEAAAAAPTSPQIHGFFDSPFKTAYITPRGLVVENQGLVWQPVVGLIFPLPDIGIKNFSLDAGVWNSVNTNQGDSRVGAWNEMDVWVGVGGDIVKNLSFHIDYEVWSFPQSTVNKPSSEHLSQLKFSYNDADLWGKSGFALNPYVNFFYQYWGSSTVVLGRQGNTWYVEPGIAPTYTWKLGDTPITFTMPTYVSIGPESYWGRGGTAFGGTVSAKPDGNLGVFSTGITATIPLKFIPIQYGNWHAEAGVLYYNLINDALLRAGKALSGNSDRSVFNGFVGIGVGF